MIFGMKPNKLKDTMKRFEFWKEKLSPILGILLVLLNILALCLLIWSLWPIPRQVFSIDIPATYWSEFYKESYQFPTQRTLTMDFPIYLKLGDTHEVKAVLGIGEPVPQVRGEGCIDFCTLKHPGLADIWGVYDIKAQFANDLSNILIQPPGETVLPLAPDESQSFIWQIKPLNQDEAYLKNTVSLNYLEKNSTRHELVLIFARELNFKVLSVGHLGMPIVRILCLILILSSSVWYILGRLSRADSIREKSAESISENSIQ
jgi:hypothetical protein